MKNPIWEREWLQIKFKTLKVPLTIFKRPTSKLYNAFYNKIFIKYENFDALPFKWRQQKAAEAKSINSIINSDNCASSVLSLGCGLGFVEKSLIEINPTIKLDTFDFSDIAKKWLIEIEGINCLTKLNSANKYKFIYCTQLLYSFSDKEIKDLASLIFRYLEKNGKFLTVDTSLNPIENSSKSIKTISIINLTKKYLRPFKRILDLFKYILIGRGTFQFWGWQRDNSEIIKLLESNGLSLIKKNSSVGRSFLTFELNDN